MSDDTMPQSDGAMDRSSIAQIIHDRAVANGVDPATLLRIGQVESSLNPNAGAKSSSAKGLFQFIDPTWQRYGGGSDPFDPVANADAGARLLRDNGAALRNAGLDPSPGSLYLAHFAGTDGARKLLTADPNMPVVAVLGDAAVRANPFLRNMTVAGVRAWSDRKMGDTSAPAQSTPSAAPPADRTGNAGRPVTTPGIPAGGAPVAPVAPEEPAINPSTLAALQALPQQLAQKPLTPTPQQINTPVPPGLARARALALAMMNQPIS